MKIYLEKSEVTKEIKKLEKEKQQTLNYFESRKDNIIKRINKANSYAHLRNTLQEEVDIIRGTISRITSIDDRIELLEELIYKSLPMKNEE